MTNKYNTAPYYDDYNSEKNYHKILFKPGVPVQARELNQVQSIINNKIEKLTSVLLKKYSKVSGARSKVSLTNLVDLNFINNPAFFKIGNIIRTPTVTLEVYNVEQFGTWTTRIWFDITNYNGTSRVSNTINTGAQTWTLVDSNISVNVTVKQNFQTNIFTVDDGVFSVDGNFVNVFRHSIWLPDYGNFTKNFLIGLEIVESVVNSNSDSSLLDNSLGYSNESAPGADRQKIELKLATKIVSDSAEAYTTENSPELLPGDSGTFSSGVGSWVNHLDASITSVNGRLRLTKGASSELTYVDVPVEIAKKYVFKVDVFSGTGRTKCVAISDHGGIWLTPFLRKTTDSDSFNIEFIPQTTQIRIHLFCFDSVGQYVEFDNASLKEAKELIFNNSDNSQFDQSDFSNFITLARVDGRELRYLNNDIEFSEINDLLARRTYEESGNYVAKDFSYRIAESYAASNNIDSKTTGNPNKLVMKVYDGTAYVKGYRVNATGTLSVEFDKARDISTLNDSSFRIDNASYILGTPTANKNPSPTALNSTGVLDRTLVTLYDNTVANGGSAIGTCWLYDTEYVSGTVGSDAVYAYKITKISGNIKNAKSCRADSINFAIDLVLTDNSLYPEVFNSTETVLIHRLNTQEIVSLRDLNDKALSSVRTTIRKKLKGTLNSSGIITFTAGFNELFEARNNNVICYLEQSGVYTSVLLDSNNSNFLSTTITINLTSAQQNKSIVVICNTLKSFIKERTKTWKTHNKLITLTSQDIADLRSSSGLALDHADVYRIHYVRKYTTNINNFTSASQIILNKNITDFSYELSRLRDTVTPYSVGDKLSIFYYYFEHSADDGFFSIDSYTAAINDSASLFTRGMIGESGFYTSSQRLKYKLSDCLDFRRLYNDTSANYSLLTNTSVVADISYYGSRKDLIALDSNGTLFNVKGVPGRTPVAPVITDDYIPLFELTIPPFTYSRNDVLVTRVNNRKYTMRDIGKIEKRIENVEYYVALNLLEKSAVDLQTKDINGFDRFKNGFFVDNFVPDTSPNNKEFSGGDLTNSEFRCSYSKKYKELRPVFVREMMSLDVLSDAGMKRVGNNYFYNYNASQNRYTGGELLTEQLISTKSMPISVFSTSTKVGTLKFLNAPDLRPVQTQRSAIDTVIDAQIGNFTGTIFGSWVVDNNSQTRTVTENTLSPLESQIQSTLSSINSGAGSVSAVQSYTVSTTSNQSRQNTTVTVSDRVDKREEGLNAVTNIEILPYMKDQTIQMEVNNLTPYTLIYCYFDGVQIQNVYTPGQTSTLGFLLTDHNGYCRFDLEIKRSDGFYNGSKVIKVSDVPFDSQATGGCYAIGYYYAQGMSVEKQQQNFVIKSSSIESSLSTEPGQVTTTSLGTVVLARGAQGERGETGATGAQGAPGTTTVIREPVLTSNTTTMTGTAVPEIISRNDIVRGTGSVVSRNPSSEIGGGTVTVTNVVPSAGTVTQGLSGRDLTIRAEPWTPTEQRAIQNIVQAAASAPTEAARTQGSINAISAIKERGGTIDNAIAFYMGNPTFSKNPADVAAGIAFIRANWK